MTLVLLAAGALLAAPPSVLGQPGGGPPDDGGMPGITSSTLGPACDETGVDADYTETLRCALALLFLLLYVDPNR